MAPPNPKNPSRPRPAVTASKPPVRRRPPTEELPFSDDEVLHADDPRPQRVAQYPSETARRAAPKRPEEEALPTTVYEISQDEEFPPTYDAKDLSDPGYKPAFLYVEKGPGQGQLLEVKQGSVVIGRASVSDLRLQHPSVSRRHAQVTRLGERFYLKDLGSQNATYVNKVKIETEIEIYPGDQLQIGNALIKLRGPAEKLPEAAKKQIEKAAAKSAKRKPVAEGARQGPNKLLLGVACTAIGFGLASVLLFVVLNVTHKEPTFEELPAQAGAAAAAAPSVDTAAAPSERDPVSERIAREMQERKAAAAAAVEPVVEQDAPVKVAPEPVRPTVAAATPSRPAPTAQAIARKSEPRAQPKRSTAAPAASRSAADAAFEAEEEAEAPSARGGASNAEILKLYEAGSVSAAIQLAKSSGDKDLAGKLTEFQAAYSAGEKAEKAGDGTAAIKSYQRALAVDEKISGGWGKHGPAISKKLGNLYTLVGQYYLRDDDTQNARLAFQAALKYDPANGVAKKHLAGMSDGGTRPAAKKAMVDEAFEEDVKPAKASKPAPAPAKKSTKSAIDEAWED